MTDISQGPEGSAEVPADPLSTSTIDIKARLEKLESVSAWTSKVSIISAAVAVVMGGGGILGYIQYFSEAPGKRQLNAVDIFSKETGALISIAEKLESKGNKAQADLLFNRAASIAITYVDSQAKYVPVERPTPIPLVASQSKQEILRTLPDTGVRIAVATIVNGQLVYSPAKFISKGQNYQITLDYLNYRLESVSQVIKVPTLDKEIGRLANASGYLVIGVGIRLTLVILSKADLPLSPNLAALGQAADRGLLEGTWTLQTLGLTGKSVATAIPLPEGLSSSSIEKVATVIRRFKDLLAAPDTLLTPRIVGLQPDDGFGSWKPVDPMPTATIQPSER